MLIGVERDFALNVSGIADARDWLDCRLGAVRVSVSDCVPADGAVVRADYSVYRLAV